MSKGRLIIKKESFGGQLIDTENENIYFLTPEEYIEKSRLLSEEKSNKNQKIQFIDVTEKGYPLLKNAVSSPNNIFWELTKKCNGTCNYCFMDSNSKKFKGNESSFNEIENIIKQFYELGGYSIRLSGGEPTIRKDFFDIIDLMNDADMMIGLNTNGFFNEKTLFTIFTKNIKDIRISMDGPELLNDSIRGPENYKKAVNTIRNIYEYNKSVDKPIQITINVVLMKQNLEYIEEMMEFAHSLNSKISFGLLRLSGRAQKQEILSPEEVVQASFRVQKMRERMDFTINSVRINYDIFCEKKTNENENKYSPFPFDHSKCLFGSAGFSLNAYARIVPCGYLSNSEEWVGEDIRERDLLDIWHTSPLLNKARAVKRPGCMDCKHHIKTCNGGCPAMAYFLTGDIDGKDPYCVKDIQKAII